MKRISKAILLLFTLVLCLSLLLACGDTDNNSGGNNGNDPGTEKPSHSHSFEETERVEPSCEADGYVVSVCNECGETSQTTIPALTHVKGELIYSSDSTCKDAGEDVYECTVCGGTISEKKPLSTTHYEEYIEYIEPTCIHSGYEGASYCVICETVFSFDTEIPATGIHSPMEYETQYPTCYDPGYYGGTFCYVCEVHLTDRIQVPPQEHRYSFQVTTAPTIDSEGEKVYTCIDCSHSYSEVMEKITYRPEDVWDGSVATSFSSGDGTEFNPYVIMTASELAYFARTVNEGTRYNGMYIELGADIVLNDTVNYPKWGSSANVWTPIGSVNRANCTFQGNFDGKNHTVRGIYSTGVDASGLFGRMDYGSIRNVRVVESTISGSSKNGGMNSAGGIVGYVDASMHGVVIDNCHFEGSVYAPYYAGGIVGYVRCGWYQMVSASKRNDNEGYATVRNCTASGNISSGSPKNIYNKDSAAGGIVGRVAYCVGYIQIEECQSSAKVESVGCGGGIVGTISSTDSYPGYFIIQIYSCTNTGNVSSLYSAGGISGLVNLRSDVYDYGTNYLEVTGCNNKGSISSSAQNEYATLGGLFGTLSVADTTYKATVENCHNSGEVTSTGFIASVGGVFGTISLKSERNTLTGCVNTANVNGSSSDNVGGIFGRISASSKTPLTVNSCYNTGNVNAGGACVGGIAGKASDLTFTNVYNTGNITGGAYYVGGIVGDCAGAKIKLAFNIGKVVGCGTNVGSIAGYILVAPEKVYFLENTAYDGGENLQGALGIDEIGIGNTSGALTKEAMANSSTYLFDFNSIWKLEEGAEYPTLVNVPTPV